MLKLHGVDPTHFLAHHWQRAPLVMRGALPDFAGWLDRDTIVELAGDETTPSRLVTADHEVFDGPLALDDAFLAHPGWTILVQSLETVFDEAWALLDAFDFLPRTSLDDVMVSFATAGGGVGAHVDLYGVFLVQARGERRWRYAAGPVEIPHGAPLAPWEFDADHDDVLAPGDILYLPPGVPHDGVAVGDCVTYSVGAAAPRYPDLLSELLAFLALDPDRVGIPTAGRFDDTIAAGRPRSGLPPALTDAVVTRAQKVRIDDDVVAEFLGRLLTAPKPHTDFAPGPDVDDAALADALASAGILKLRPASRMLIEGTRGFLNGEVFGIGDASVWRALADHRTLTLPLVLDDDEREHLKSWLESGFVDLIVD